MKKKLIVLAMFLALVLVLTGCACKHEWVEATCTVAKTCSKCEEVEGEALGHTWVDATCEAPKTCSVCGETEGEALGHTWVDADCVTPKTCSVCAATEGEALGHTWVDATCEAPKTCSVCAATEGEALPHSIGWAVNEGKLEKKCENCTYTEDSKELNLTSGVEMKAEVVNDSFVMLVPASMTTENAPADLVTPAAVYTAWDSETNTAILVETADAGQEMTTEETYGLLSPKYNEIELVKNENGRDIIVILDDPVGIQLVMMDGANLTVIVLLHADMSPVETDGALLDIYMDIASNVFSK